MYNRTGKKWTSEVICGKWMPSNAWDFDKSEEWQQLLCLIDFSSLPVSHSELHDALSESIVYLTKNNLPVRTKALHLGMKLRLQGLLDELVLEGYLVSVNK